MSDECVRRKSVSCGSSVVARTAWRGMHVQPPHVHDETRIVVVVDGSFDEQSAKQSRRCEPGFAIFRPAGEVHSERYDTGGGTYVSVALSPEACDDPPLRDVLARLGPYVRSPVLRALGSRLADEILHADRWSALSVQGLSLEIVAAMGRRRADQHGRQPRFIASVCEMLHNDRSRHWTLDGISAATDVAASNVSRSFRRHVGMSIGDYLRSLRVQEARRLIVSTERTLADIAAETGFSDQSHLTRSFRRVLGIAPSTYRQTAIDTSTRSNLSDPS